jgi:uncharacterized damage-inducible protein DinB
MPPVTVLRTFLLDQMNHHRGQLTVCLRVKDVPLPGISGPTADERVSSLPVRRSEVEA